MFKCGQPRGSGSRVLEKAGSMGSAEPIFFRFSAKSVFCLIYVFFSASMSVSGRANFLPKRISKTVDTKGGGQIKYDNDDYDDDNYNDFDDDDDDFDVFFVAT